MEIDSKRVFVTPKRKPRDLLSKFNPDWLRHTCTFLTIQEMLVIRKGNKQLYQRINALKKLASQKIRDILLSHFKYPQLLLDIVHDHKAYFCGPALFEAINNPWKMQQYHIDCFKELHIIIDNDKEKEFRTSLNQNGFELEDASSGMLYPACDPDDMPIWMIEVFYDFKKDEDYASATNEETSVFLSQYDGKNLIIASPDHFATKTYRTDLKPDSKRDVFYQRCVSDIRFLSYWGFCSPQYKTKTSLQQVGSRWREFKLAYIDDHPYACWIKAPDENWQEDCDTRESDKQAITTGQYTLEDAIDLIRAAREAGMPFPNSYEQYQETKFYYTGFDNQKHRLELQHLYPVYRQITTPSV